MLTISPSVSDELRDCFANDRASPTRQRMYEEIIRVNPSAGVSFLNRFSDEALRLYVEHLQIITRPRGRDAVWVRPCETPAILASQPD